MALLSHRLCIGIGFYAVSAIFKPYHGGITMNFLNASETPRRQTQILISRKDRALQWPLLVVFR